jgi:hypothetical protein
MAPGAEDPDVTLVPGPVLPDDVEGPGRDHHQAAHRFPGHLHHRAWPRRTRPRRGGQGGPAPGWQRGEQDRARYLNLVTRYDQLVRPYTVGVVEGPRATNITIQDGCEQNRAEHLAIASDPRTADFVLNALDPADPREPRCEAVAPYLGPIPPLPGS